MKPNIYYIIPDLGKPDYSFTTFAKRILARDFSGAANSLRRTERAIGGVKVAYQHCIALNRAGINAYPLLMGNYKGNHYNYDLAYIHHKPEESQVKDGDIVVATEYLPYQGLKFPNATRIMFVQNWINIDRKYKELPGLMGKREIGSAKHTRYRDLGYDHIITCGRYISERLSALLHEDSTAIPNGIDIDVFKPKVESRIENRILCLPRKNPHHINRLKQLIPGSSAHIVEADGLSQSELVVEYQKSDIFAPTGYPEGYPLPPLEAMACGCAVVGFTGGGGSDYMINNKTAITSPDGDVESLAKNLKSVLEDKTTKERIRSGGLRKANEHSLDTMESNVVKYFNKIIN
jgi:glycosyltransferase involved in cell wall biosynthesis